MNAFPRLDKNLDTTIVNNNHKFWRTVKPLFSDKVQVPTSLTLLENNKLISNDEEVAEVFNNYFANITDSLGIKEIKENISSVSGLVDPIDIAIKEFSLHPSIIRIQSNTKYTERFSFSEVSIQQVASQLARLDPKKSSPVGAIPAKILKEYPDIFAQNLCNLFNQSFAHSIFPLELKSGEITSLFKKDDASLKNNFRPITVLPAVSKVFERLPVNAIRRLISLHIAMRFSKRILYTKCAFAFSRKIQNGIR